jgi:hypothetical protein
LGEWGATFVCGPCLRSWNDWFPGSDLSGSEGGVRQVHVIPVPRGMTPEEAFAEIETFGELVEYRWWRLRFRWPWRRWAVVEVDG